MTKEEIERAKLLFLIQRRGKSQWRELIRKAKEEAKSMETE